MFQDVLFDEAMLNWNKVYLVLARLWQSGIKGLLAH